MHEAMLPNLLTALLETPQPQPTYIIPHKITPTSTAIENKMALCKHSSSSATPVIFNFNFNIIIEIKYIDRVNKQ